MRGRHGSSMIRLGVATALVLALGACTPGGQFDPTELLNLDMLQTKKKIEGQREPVFPEGVPGAAAAGVPPELMQGYQAPPEKAADATASTTAAPPTAAPPTEAKVEPKPKAKPKPKPKVARAPPPQPAA